MPVSLVASIRIIPIQFVAAYPDVNVAVIFPVVALNVILVLVAESIPPRFKLGKLI